jgi:hypothetical protein
VQDHNVFMRTSEPAVQKKTGTTDAIKAMGILREMKVSWLFVSLNLITLTDSRPSSAEQGLNGSRSGGTAYIAEEKMKSKLESKFCPQLLNDREQ